MLAKGPIYHIGTVVVVGWHILAAAELTARLHNPVLSRQGHAIIASLGLVVLVSKSWDDVGIQQSASAGVGG